MQTRRGGRWVTHKIANALHVYLRFGKPNFREGDTNNKACANCTQEDICVLDLCFGVVSHYKDKLMMLGNHDINQQIWANPATTKNYEWRLGKVAFEGNNIR